MITVLVAFAPLFCRRVWGHAPVLLAGARIALARRTVLVSAQRTRLDFARGVKALVDVYYPEAAKIVLVLDQLNTDSPASLYAAVPAAEAKRLTGKLGYITPRNMGVGAIWRSWS